MLIIQNGENKSVQVGVQHAEAQTRFKSLMDLFALYPAEIHIYNRTKTARVEYRVENNRAMITITDPQDEIFKL